MAGYFDCPYLGATVELTDEREAHIRRLHIHVLATGNEILAGTLEAPDIIRQDVRAANTLLFTRWYDDLAGGKYAVVVVVRDLSPGERHWIVTAYVARRVPQRNVIWNRS